MSDFSGIAIFCDDIREEIGGKVSYMGIYGEDMVLGVPAPVLLPKFCVAAHVRFPRETKEGRVRILLQKDQDGETTELTSVETTVQEIGEAPPGAWQQGIFHLVATAFPVSGDCNIKVRAYLDEVEYRLGALSIRVPTATAE